MKDGVGMKKIIMLMMVALTLTLSISTKLFAQDLTQDEEKCTCGTDEDGECLPCKE